MTQFEHATHVRHKLATLVEEELTIRELVPVCKKVLFHPKFVTQFGSQGKHHAYEGGLAAHTFEVVNYAMQMGKMFPPEFANPDVILTAAIYHDYMKVEEYKAKYDDTGTRVLGVGTKPFRHLIRHVAGSHAAFMQEIKGLGIDEDIITRIQHAILAHHGRLEWGSPVEPVLVEAFILHTADMFSVQYGARR